MTTDATEPKTAPATGSETVPWQVEQHGFTLFVTRHPNGIFTSHMSPPSAPKFVRAHAEGCLGLEMAKGKCWRMMEQHLRWYLSNVESALTEFQNH